MLRLPLPSRITAKRLLRYCSYHLLALLTAGISNIAPVLSEEPAKFTVACILPLSGRSAEYGNAVKNGIELAQQNRPELFKRIRFIYEDSLYDGKTTITAFQKLMTADHADLSFVWGHGPAQAVAPVAEGSRKPALLVSGQRDVAAEKKYVVRFCSPHVVFANALLHELRKHGHKRIAVVRTELGFLNDTVEALKAGIRGPESFELIDTFQPGETDFQSTITKLKSKEYDLLGLFIGEDQTPLFISRMAAVKLNPALFGTHNFGSKDGITAVRRHTNGAFFAANYVDEAFHRQYSAEFHGDIQITWAANAYDFAMLTAELFANQNNKPTPEQIIAAYQNVQEQKGITGTYRFVSDQTHGSGFVFPVVIKTISKSGVEEAPLEE